MAGFDNAQVDAEFFAIAAWKSLFLLNLGYSDASKLHPRTPRLRAREWLSRSMIAAPAPGWRGATKACCWYVTEE
jgi:hypothetical protein